MKLRFDLWEAIKIFGDPENEGIPYLCRQILGTEKGNTISPFIISLLNQAKTKSPQDVQALVASVSAQEGV